MPSKFVLELLPSVDQWITAKMEGYWEWSKNDSRLELINPWHWNSQQAVDGPDKPRRYARGANEFPLLRAKLREIGETIKAGKITSTGVDT